MQLLGLSSPLPGRQLTRACSVRKGRSQAAVGGQTPRSRPAASPAPSHPPTRLGFRLPQTLPAAAQQLVQLPHSGKRGAQPCSTPPPCHQRPHLGSRASPPSHCPPCAQGLCQNPRWRDGGRGRHRDGTPVPVLLPKGKHRTLHPDVTFGVQITAPLLKSCDTQEGTFTHSCSFIRYLLSISSVPDSQPGPGDAGQQTGSALHPKSESLGQVGWRKPGPTALR